MTTRAVYFWLAFGSILGFICGVFLGAGLLAISNHSFVSPEHANEGVAKGYKIQNELEWTCIERDSYACLLEEAQIPSRPVLCYRYSGEISIHQYLSCVYVPLAEQ